MKYLIFLIILLGLGYLKAESSLISQQMTIAQSTSSAIYNRWLKQFGEWDFKKAYQNNGGIGNKEYSFQTNWAILDMIAQDDIVGLEQIYKKLEADIEHNMAFFNGIASPSISFEQQAIDKASIKALSFLLEKSIIDINVTLEDIEEQKEYSLCAYATQKLQDAEAKGDSKAIENYKRILEILQKYYNSKECCGILNHIKDNPPSTKGF